MSRGLAVYDRDLRLRTAEMFSEKFNHGGVGLAVMGAGMGTDNELAGRGFFDGLDLRAGFDEDGVFHVAILT